MSATLALGSLADDAGEARCGEDLLQRLVVVEKASQLVDQPVRRGRGDIVAALHQQIGAGPVRQLKQPGQA